MDDDLARAVQDLKYRQAILDCIHRYCHGMDRLDRDLVLSAYHEDAWDDHGTICAPAAEFVDFTIARHTHYLTETHQHLVTNHRCEIDGAVAHATTYFLYCGTPKQTLDTSGHRRMVLSGGRYVDRFENREGKWAIADRVCLLEWNTEVDASDLPAEAGLASSGVAARDRSDLQYRRPLRVVRERSEGS